MLVKSIDLGNADRDLPMLEATLETETGGGTTIIVDEDEAEDMMLVLGAALVEVAATAVVVVVVEGIMELDASEEQPMVTVTVTSARMGAARRARMEKKRRGAIATMFCLDWSDEGVRDSCELKDVAGREICKSSSDTEDCK